MKRILAITVALAILFTITTAASVKFKKVKVPKYEGITVLELNLWLEGGDTFELVVNGEVRETLTMDAGEVGIATVRIPFVIYKAAKAPAPIVEE